MTLKDRYKIVFQKIILPNGHIDNIAITNVQNGGDLVNHIRYSDASNTADQIQYIDHVVSNWQRGTVYDEFWGEVFGSSLFIYPDTNSVEVGDGSSIYSIADFKLLLQEWLTFIS
jgi:hypothetical protein